MSLTLHRHFLSLSMDLLSRCFLWSPAFFSLVGFRLCWECSIFCLFFSLVLTKFNRNSRRDFFLYLTWPFSVLPPLFWCRPLSPIASPSADGFCFVAQPRSAGRQPLSGACIPGKCRCSQSISDGHVGLLQQFIFIIIIHFPVPFHLFLLF